MILNFGKKTAAKIIGWYRVIDAAAYVFSPTLKSALITQTTVGLRQEWQGRNDFFMYNAYNMLCAQHATALPPSPGRETRERVSAWPQQPSGDVFSSSFTGGPVDPENSLSWPSSRACRG